MNVYTVSLFTDYEGSQLRLATTSKRKAFKLYHAYVAAIYQKSDLSYGWDSVTIGRWEKDGSYTAMATDSRF